MPSPVAIDGLPAQGGAFAAYRSATPDRKIAIAHVVARVAEKRYRSRAVGVAARRVAVLATLTDLDHVAELDAEMEGLRRTLEPGVMVP